MLVITTLTTYHNRILNTLMDAQSEIQQTLLLLDEIYGLREKKYYVPEFILKLKEALMYSKKQFYTTPCEEMKVQWLCVKNALNLCMKISKNHQEQRVKSDIYVKILQEYIRCLIEKSDILYKNYKNSWYPGDKFKSMGLNGATHLLLDVLMEFTSNVGQHKFPTTVNHVLVPTHEEDFQDFRLFFRF